MNAIDRALSVSAGIGVIGLALSLIGALHDPADFYKNYLFSFLFWLDLPLGALALAMVFPLTGGRWSEATRGILEAISSTLMPVALFGVPVFLGLRWIYPWMDPAVISRGSHQQVYFRPAFFIFRTVLYFAGWLVLNFFRWRYAESPARLRRLCSGGLVLLGFSVSFASIDWQMSVEPAWHSTIYGMVYATGQVLSAYALGLIAFGFAAGRKDPADRFPSTTLLDLGNLLLMLVMTWAYLSFMQYLIVWSGNLPHEVVWFQHRTQNGWQWLALALALFQFGAPFILLLFRASKRKAFRLACVAAVVLAARIVDHYWMLIPGLAPAHLTLHWQACTTWLGIGGVWCALFLRKLTLKPIFSDPEANIAV